ncbi:ribonuclease HII [Deltaproteobacteria bacterium Smac51]|nr:ribonuclease HII [Deltaproteobacteria bacterium Smac51]
MRNMFDDSGLDAASFDALFRERTGVLAGVDEAGRGPLAGPVVAAAVVLDPAAEYPGVTDSKKMKEAARTAAYEMISARALAWAWAAVEADEVDRLNPLHAAMKAMRLAVEKLAVKPEFLLVDGNYSPGISIPLKTVVKGDYRSLSIGAASIMAKVTRDRIMTDMHQVYPQYGFDKHKGYGTAVHLKALVEHGPCPCHRLTFRGVRQDEAPAVKAEGFDFDAGR